MKTQRACVTSMIFNLRREYFIYMKNQGEDGKNKPTQEKWKTVDDRHYRLAV